jgi:stage II sporulation protein P
MMIMRQWKNRLLVMAMAVAVLGCAGLLVAGAPGFSLPGTGGGSYGLEWTAGKYFTIVDEDNKPLDYTAHVLYPGDEFISAGNQRYRISEVKGNIATAQLLGKEAAVATGSLPETVAGASGQVADGQQAIAIYHTHSDESYVPTEGTSSVYAHGGVFEVGNAFAAKLQSEGFKVLHSLRSHDPHDSNAYVRSRRTAVELLKSQPVALFDVQRDSGPRSGPPSVATADVNSQPITGVNIVLGSTNHHVSANLQFAKEIKTAEDQLHPGLIKGILLTKGNFNQDLSPRALLIEVGADTNSQQAAEASVSLFAEAIPKVLGSAAGNPGVEWPATGANRANWNAALWICLVVAGALAVYLYINAGSWQGVWDQVRRFFGHEFGSRLRGGK